MAKPRTWALRLRPLREVMQAMPITESINSSGEPKVRTRDARWESREPGSARRSKRQPESSSTPRQAHGPLRRALPWGSRPRLWRRTTLARNSKKDGCDVAGRCRHGVHPSKKAKASTGPHLKTKGIISAKVAAPPIPGSKPTQNPNPMPRIIRLKAFHCKTRKRPSMKASNILGYTSGLDRIRILL